MQTPSRIILAALLALGAGLRTFPADAIAASPVPLGNWAGTYRTSVSTGAVRIDIQLRRHSVLVALGPGHAALQSASIRGNGSAFSFALPGLPTPLAFSLRLQGHLLVGTARQGTAAGTARLRASKPTPNRFLGNYRATDGNTLVVLDLSRLGIPPQVIDLGTDGFRALYARTATTFALGAGNETRQPESGSIRFAADGSSLVESLPGARPIRATRLQYRELEVRYRSGRATIAATLELPQGTGPFPAAMMVHGSGPSWRDEGQAFSGYLASRGIASLKIDKRGIGQSTGLYPGELASDRSIATYATDTIAGGRFLASLPAIDRRKIGLFGGSQAGWIIPEAAAKSGSLFAFAVILSGPVVSVGETATYSSLTSQGASRPAMTPGQIDAEVSKLGPSGVDPRAWIPKLHISMFWVYGGLDQHQPTDLDLRVLERIKSATGADLSWVVFPHANHGLVDTQTGLNSGAAKAPSFAHGLFASLTKWFVSHSLSG